MSVTVRRATVGDVPAIRRVARRAWEAAHQPIVGSETTERFLREYYDAASVEAHVDDPEGVFLVAGADPVGFALARPVEDGFALSWCYVDPDRWGEGVGSRLLDAVERRVADRGGDRIELAVMVANEGAVGFYEAMDYDRVGRFHDGNAGTDSYTYEKVLDPDC